MQVILLLLSSSSGERERKKNCKRFAKTRRQRIVIPDSQHNPYSIFWHNYRVSSSLEMQQKNLVHNCITVCSKRAKMIIQLYLLCRFLAKQCLEVSQPCLVRNCPDFQVQSWWRPHFHPKCFQSRVRPLRTVRIRRFQCCRLNSPR